MNHDFSELKSDETGYTSCKSWFGTGIPLPYSKYLFHMFSGSELERAFFLFCSAGLSRQRAPINESVVAHDGERSGILGRVKVAPFFAGRVLQGPADHGIFDGDELHP